MKEKLKKAIERVNHLYAAGRNDDDAVKKMIEIDRATKGWTFKPEYDSYTLCTDEDRLYELMRSEGINSAPAEKFQKRLILKGGGSYFKDTRQRVLSRLNIAHRYRILTAEYKVKFTGGASWFTLDKAKELADIDSGDKIYEYDTQGRKLWEVC